VVYSLSAQRLGAELKGFENSDSCCRRARGDMVRFNSIGGSTRWGNVRVPEGGAMAVRREADDLVHQLAAALGTMLVGSEWNANPPILRANRCGKQLIQ
jgi:hypothetical protein